MEECGVVGEVTGWLFWFGWLVEVFWLVWLFWLVEGCELQLT